MTIDPREYAEKYKIDEKWIGEDDEILPNAPQAVKERWWAWNYLCYGEIPYDGYKFPYDDTGITSNFELE